MPRLVTYNSTRHKSKFKKKAEFETWFYSKIILKQLFIFKTAVKDHYFFYTKYIWFNVCGLKQKYSLYLCFSDEILTIKYIICDPQLDSKCLIIKKYDQFNTSTGVV